jgi:hypothetical protein
MDLDEVNLAVSEAVRHGCSCAGATPLLPDEVRSRLTTPVNATSASKLTRTSNQIPTLQ